MKFEKMSKEDLENYIRERQEEVRALARGDPHGPGADAALDAAQEERRRRYGRYLNIDGTDA